jgi:hypothetical protein
MRCPRKDLHAPHGSSMVWGEEEEKRQNEGKEKSSGKAKCAGGVCASPYAPRSSFVIFYFLEYRRECRNSPRFKEEVP